ncbi:hypothetical protein M0Q50_05250 [bacterium]|jgi:hypothetical protein|nr:hypothetical protein [bacterium]
MIIRKYKKDIDERYKRIYYCVYVVMVEDDIIVNRIESSVDEFGSYGNLKIFKTNRDGFLFKTTKKEKMPINIEELLIESLYNNIKKRIVGLEKDKSQLERRKKENEKLIDRDIKEYQLKLKNDSFNIITRKYKLKTLL